MSLDSFNVKVARICLYMVVAHDNVKIQALAKKHLSTCWNNMEGLFFDPTMLIMAKEVFKIMFNESLMKLKIVIRVHA